MADRMHSDIEKRTTRQQSKTGRTEASKVAAPDPMSPMGLQRLIGNQRVNRLLASESASVQAAPSTFIQAKLSVGAANDRYEVEADQVADAVLSQTDAVQREAVEEDELQMSRDIQREAMEEDELQMSRDIQREAMEEDELQMSRSIQAMESETGAQPVDMSGAFEVGGDVESNIDAKRGRGNSMDAETKTFFESRMGYDFSSVNIHTDGEASNLSQQLSARAFTTGSDIFFGSGQYRPESDEGKKLIAHELTHVVQQGSAQKKHQSEE